MERSPLDHSMVRTVEWDGLWDMDTWCGTGAESIGPFHGTESIGPFHGTDSGMGRTVGYGSLVWDRSGVHWTILWYGQWNGTECGIWISGVGQERSPLDHSMVRTVECDGLWDMDTWCGTGAESIGPFHGTDSGMGRTVGYGYLVWDRSGVHWTIPWYGQWNGTDCGIWIPGWDVGTGAESIGPFHGKAMEWDGQWDMDTWLGTGAESIGPFHGKAMQWDGLWDMDTWLGQERSPLDCPNGPWEFKTVTKDCDGKLGHHSFSNGKGDVR